MSNILVTGATGGLGKAVVENLLKTTSSAQLSVLVRDPAKAADLQAQGVTIRQGDYEDYASLTAAFVGVEKLLLVAGNDVPRRTPQHTNVINAAKEAGVKHLVYTSFQRKTEDGSSPIAFVTDAHLATEKLLHESGLVYTILLNSLYLDVLPQLMGPQVLETGTIYLGRHGPRGLRQPGRPGRGGDAHGRRPRKPNLRAGERHDVFLRRHCPITERFIG